MKKIEDPTTLHHLSLQAKKYLSAFTDRSISNMLPFVAPKVLEKLGGEENFEQCMKQIFSEADGNLDKAAMLDITIQDPKEICSIDSKFISILKSEVPFVLEGKLLGIINGITIALSSDKGEHWVFVEGTENGLSLLDEKEQETLEQIGLPKPSFKPVKGRKRIYKDQSSMQRHMLLMTLSIMKPEMVADSALDLRKFVQQLFKNAKPYE